MDRVVKKKRWNRKRILTITGITALVLLIVLSYLYTSGKSKLNVDLERISISEVKKGPFQETIPVNGVVRPLTTIYLDAVEGGRVEEKFVDDGTTMKRGEPISKNAAEQNTVTKLNQMTDVESQLKEAERIYMLDKGLYEQKVIGLQEFKKSENDYNYYLKKKKLTEQLLQQDSASNAQQVSQAKQSYEGSQNALNVMRQKAGDLIVRAPVDGQLTSLDAEVGESKNKGERLGQIDVLSGFKVRADIDEHYISRIINGLYGTFTFANKDYKLEIKKVYTQVTNGRFQVDMEFVGDVPKGIRRGQTLQIRLAFSDEVEAVQVAKGGFYQQTGGNWIFKVSDDGTKAYKVNIQLGRQNPDYYEVLSGLKPGDKVVTSSYENYGDMQELVLKK